MAPKPDRREFLAALTALGLSPVTHALPRSIGGSRRPIGERAPSETSKRYFREGPTPATGSSRTPLQDLMGIITPSALHFERHHAGIPDIDPATHSLLIHGAVENPVVLTMEELRRLPSVSQINFIECAGNTAAEQRGVFQPNVQRTHGLLSCSEWTGVPLRVLFKGVHLKPEAKWVIAEGADACRLARSIPLEKTLDDVIVAYGQNGEALRPEQGYPLRLVVPGWEGNTWIKWLHRLHVSHQPSMHREESSYYTDLMPGGKARRFTFVMEAKSVITYPSGEQRLKGRGLYEIRGYAWSGRGKIQRVDVSTDGGGTWTQASLQTPVLPKAVTMFRLPWWWRGEEELLQSRCTDDTEYVQPTREQIIAVRGVHGTDHYNGIKSWKVQRDGLVVSV